MRKKMKLRNIPKAMILTIPAYITWVCAYVSVLKENAIAWNKMVTSMVKFESTYDDDLENCENIEFDCD